MVTTRSQTPAKPARPSRSNSESPSKSPAKSVGNKWAESDGTGDREGFLIFTSGKIAHAIQRGGTMFFLTCFPIIAVFMWHIVEHCKGSVTDFINGIQSSGLDYFKDNYPRPTMTGVTYLATFGLIEAVLQLLLPGKQYKGPTTPKGNVPVYKANGTQAYLTTIALFFLGWHLEWFDPAAVYDNLGDILSTSNIFSLILCFCLMIKGRVAPSSSDSGTTGSLIFDFYWGTELFPRIGSKFDIKTWTNCRVGMMSWAVLPLCYAVKQYSRFGFLSNSMLVSVVLMQTYVFKFFLWETGYWGSMDIAHDRAGFYLCWGCLVWVPSIYTSPTMYMVNHPTQLPTHMAAALLAFGFLMIYINYDCDRQRQQFRKTGGKEKIWGKTPTKIVAKYMTGDGKTKESLLLTSGWWGMARHFHYMPEILAAFSWSCATGFSSITPFLYVLFLTGLLADRAFRDDERCHAKYGKYWEKYQKLVPYKVVPGVF